MARGLRLTSTQIIGLISLDRITSDRIILDRIISDRIILDEIIVRIMGKTEISVINQIFINKNFQTQITLDKLTVHGSKTKEGQ